MIKKISTVILNFFDYFYKIKIVHFLKKKINIEILIDVGGHQGESIFFFVKHFKLKKIYSFEPSKNSYNKLVFLVKNFLIKKKIKFELCNVALGSKVNKLYMNIAHDTSSSTIRKIDKKSEYFKKKNKFLGKNNKNFFEKRELIKVMPLDFFMKKYQINFVDMLKIDTEGYEYEVLLGSKKILKNTKLVLFEHHYDNMILKNYKFFDIHNFLISKNFKQIFKVKMPFRKSFDYIYENKKIK